MVNKKKRKKDFGFIVVFLLIIGLFFIFNTNLVKASPDDAYWSSTNPATGVTEINSVTILETPHPQDGYYYLVIEDAQDFGFEPCGSEENPGCVYFELIEEDGQDNDLSNDDIIRTNKTGGEYGDFPDTGARPELKGWVDGSGRAITKINLTFDDFDDSTGPEENSDSDLDYEFYFTLNASLSWLTEGWEYKDLPILNASFYFEEESFCDESDYTDYDNKDTCESNLCDYSYDGCEEEFLGFQWNENNQKCEPECSGVSFCDTFESYSDYLNESACENNICDAEYNNCGENETFEGFSWNSQSGDCNAVCQKIPGVCNESESCWYMRDFCTDSCECEEGYEIKYLQDGERAGYCVETPSELCIPGEDECWVTGDHCSSNCQCTQGEPTGNGGCDGNDGCNVSDDCWLQGDNCNSSCMCEPGFEIQYTRGGDKTGYCVNVSEDICTPQEDSCWKMGEDSHCNSSCMCEPGFEPYVLNSVNQGYCVKKGLSEPYVRCIHKDKTTDDCRDGLLNYTWTAELKWGEGNIFTDHGCTDTSCCESNYDYEYTYSQEACRYDPNNIQQSCQGGSEVRACPENHVNVPFFNIYNLVFTLLFIGIMYYFFWDSKKRKLSFNKK